MSETRARKITGHAPRTKGEKYIQHDLTDLAAATAMVNEPEMLAKIGIRRRDDLGATEPPAMTQAAE